MTAAAPNFGIAYASLGGQPLVSAQSAIQSFDKQDWDESVFEGRANSFTSPLGEEYGYGKVLMIRSSLDVLDTTTRYKLKFGIGQEGNEIELDGIYVRGALVRSSASSRASSISWTPDTSWPSCAKTAPISSTAAGRAGRPTATTRPRSTTPIPRHEHGPGFV